MFTTCAGTQTRNSCISSGFLPINEAENARRQSIPDDIVTIAKSAETTKITYSNRNSVCVEQKSTATEN